MKDVFSTYFKKRDGKLVSTKKGEEAKFQKFVEELPEDTVLNVYMEVNSDNGSLAQLAKVHKCIRVLANDLGYTFDEMKLVIKDRAGLFLSVNVNDKEYQDWKSFGMCSKEELNLAIQACIALGDNLNINLR